MDICTVLKFLGKTSKFQIRKNEHIFSGFRLFGFFVVSVMEKILDMLDILK